MAYVLRIALLLFCLSQSYFAKKKMAFLGLLHKSPSSLFTFSEYLKTSPSPPLSPFSSSFLLCLSTSSFPPPPLLPTELFSTPFLAPREEQPSRDHLLGTILITVSYGLVLMKILQVIECCFCWRSETGMWRLWCQRWRNWACPPWQSSADTHHVQVSCMPIFSLVSPVLLLTGHWNFY